MRETPYFWLRTEHEDIFIFIFISFGAEPLQAAGASGSNERKIIALIYRWCICWDHRRRC